jgi:hypothetical protein
LLWYGSRHYDPAIGRFIQLDSIVPLASQGVQAWDRYAYANNNPVRYTDPSGHRCVPKEECQTPWPKWVNQDNLTDSGKSAYKTYVLVFNEFSGWWWRDPNLGGDGYLSIEDFVTMNFNEELSDLNEPKVISNWQQGIVRSFYSWKQAMSDQYTSGDAALLNFMGRHNGPNTRTLPSNFDGPTDGMSIARDVVDAILDPIGTGHSDWAKGCIRRRRRAKGKYHFLRFGDAPGGWDHRILCLPRYAGAFRRHRPDHIPVLGDRHCRRLDQYGSRGLQDERICRAHRTAHSLYRGLRLDYSHALGAIV